MAEIVKAFTETQPGLRNESAINPYEDVQKFLATERKFTLSALQQPLKGIVTNTKKAIGKIGLPIGIIGTVVNPVIDITGGIIGKTGDIAKKAINAPLNLTKNVVTGAFGLTANIPKHLLDVGVKLPASAINVAGSFAGRPFMSASAWARRLQEREINPGGIIGKITSGIRNSIEKLKIPELSPATA